MGVPITGTLGPTDPSDTFAVTDPLTGIDGLRSVADSTARNAIPTLRRRLGMMAVLQSDLSVWQLNTDTNTGTDADWTEFSAGGGGGSGTVTSVSVVSANGFAGTVASSTVAPAITVETTVTGLLKGDGTGVSAATAGTDYLTTNKTITLSSDITGSGTTAITTTLATVNSDVGSFGGSTAIPALTVNAKGLVTAASTAVVIAPAGTLSGTTLNATVVTSSLTAVGVIATGTWQGTAVAIAHGGTGQTAKQAAFDALSPLGTLGDTLYSDGSHNVVLAGNLTTAKLFLNQTGGGASSAAPIWGTVAGTDLSGTTLASTIVTSSLTAVGTIVTGVWNGTAVATAYLGATVRTFTAVLGQGVPVAVLTNAAGNYLVCSNGGSFARWDLAAVTAPVGASLVIDVLKSANQGSTWTSLWASTPSNRPTLTTTVNSGSGTAFDTTTFTAGDWLRFDVITVGSSTAGQNITLEVLSHMNQ